VKEKATEIAIECHVFTTEALHEDWGDKRGYEVSKNNRLTKRLAFVADSAGLTDEVVLVPQWYDDLVDEYNKPTPPSFIFCYSAYFWQGYTANVVPSHIKLGFTAVADGFLLFNNNKFSSWKGDVSAGCTGHRLANLIGFDRPWFRERLGIITTAGDTFTPFLNIFAFMDNRISSYGSWSSFN